jgi:hypothetical protein
MARKLVLAAAAVSLLFASATFAGSLRVMASASDSGKGPDASVEAGLKSPGALGYRVTMTGGQKAKGQWLLNCFSPDSLGAIRRGVFAGKTPITRRIPLPKAPAVGSWESCVVNVSAFLYDQLKSGRITVAVLAPAGTERIRPR